MLTRLQRLFTPEERTRLARAQSARFSCHTFRPMDSRQFAALSLLISTRYSRLCCPEPALVSSRFTPISMASSSSTMPAHSLRKPLM